MTQETIKILIVDDYAVVRHGLRALINTAPTMTIVGEAVDGHTAVQLTRELQPDVIVMDLLMPGLNGIEAIKAITQENPQARVVVLTGCGDELMVRAALDAGAQGYLLKDAVLTDLISAIRAVYEGKPALHVSVEKILGQRPQMFGDEGTDGNMSCDDKLTSRELEVLVFVAGGSANQEIADILNIKETTVRIHVSNILRKLGLENRTQLALFALRSGLATLTE